ncbi:N/A [soil metagenome]
MKDRLELPGRSLAAHIAEPSGTNRVPGLVLSHGYPSGMGGSATSARTYPELADRIAKEMGWLVVAFNFRGCGTSAGNFSLGGWLEDLQDVVTWLGDAPRSAGVWCGGFGTGGALAICAAARRPDIRGVAALGAPADFDDWAGHPKRLLQHARDIGAITDPRFPTAPDGWGRELRDIRAVASVGELRPRPLLVIHGSEDESVPPFDGRVISDAHGSAELRIIAGAGHRLRHDPRAVAILLGWLDRQRHRVPV